MSLFVLLTGCVAYLLHLGLFILLSGCLVHATILPLFLFFFSLKIIPEFILIYSVSVFFRRKNLLWLFFPAQFIYMIYISFIGAIAPFGSYHWKGRSIKPERVKFTS